MNYVKNDNASAQTNLASPQEAQSPRPSILIVDDTPANLRLLSLMLGNHGYKVRVANDGQHALDSVRANPPDLILLDIMMPDMDGYEVCGALKRTKGTAHIPVIFLSALDGSLDKVKAFAGGGVDYITKPFQIEEVLARIATHLRLHELNHQLETKNAQLETEVAERKRTEAELRQYSSELEASNAELDSFAHTVAHDLKNPLSALVGYSTLLESMFLAMPTERVSDHLHRITQTTFRTANIINELLLLASVRKMEEVDCRPLNMGSIVKEACTRLDMLIDQTEGKLVIPKLWPSAYGYAPWVEEVWVNYISNALKYGNNPETDAPPQLELGFCTFTLPEDEVTATKIAPRNDRLRLSDLWDKIPDPESTIVFWVHDEGQGIPLAQQNQLFAEFRRLKQTRAEGHGLGLSIVRRIVEKLGGVVGVQSEVGEGSTFWFTLPVAPEVGSGRGDTLGSV